ncbi:MAG: hypothetical protein HQ517_04310 [SAR324 cluster bacterium]|nr:hypothetical protein [SAR324 cluster bacterium]
MAIEAAQKLTDGRKQERIIEYLNQIGRSHNILIKSGRDYLNPDLPWLDNAVLAHQQKPFTAIISSENRQDCSVVICEEDCSEEHPLIYCPREKVIPKTPEHLSLPATLLLLNSKQVRLVDPYFDPAQARWRNSLSAFLSLIAKSAQIDTCELHYLESNTTPDPQARILSFPKLAPIIPDNITLKIIRWKTEEDGDDFHARYILTENGGMRFDSGLIEKGANKTTDVSILDKELHLKRWQMYNPNSTVYSLQSPIYIIHSRGNITEQNFETD